VEEGGVSRPDIVQVDDAETAESGFPSEKCGSPFPLLNPHWGASSRSRWPKRLGSTNAPP
jgi:hypothetical protein